MCLVWISEQTAIISLNSFLQLTGFYKRRSVFTARYGLMAETLRSVLQSSINVEGLHDPKP